MLLRRQRQKLRPSLIGKCKARRLGGEQDFEKVCEACLFSDCGNSVKTDE